MIDLRKRNFLGGNWGGSGSSDSITQSGYGGTDDLINLENGLGSGETDRILDPLMGGLNLDDLFK